VLDVHGASPEAKPDDPPPGSGDAVPAGAIAGPQTTAPAGPPAAAGDEGDDRASTASRDRVASLIEVVICSGFPTQLLVTIALAAVGIAALAPDGRLSLRYIAWLSLIDTLFIVGLAVLFLRSRGERPWRVFVGFRSMGREGLVGLALLPAAFLIVIAAAQAIESAAPWLRNRDGNPLADLLRNPLDIAVFAGVAVLAGGFREEVQRAFILHRFEQHLGGAVAGLAVFSVAFGAGHAMQGWDAAILTGLLGAFWGLVYLWRRSIVAPAVCHALFNLVEIVSHGLQA
jgi:membrane protease YdiL (CAAX protease family)